MNELNTSPARLSDDYSHIIDSSGKAIAFDDPRVVHIMTDILNPFSERIVERIYRKYGKRCRTVGRTNEEMLKYARKVCSGRECLPFMSLTGATVQDMLNRRTEDELSVYFSLEQEGPCQNAAWPVVWDTFLERMGIENVIAGVSRMRTKNNLGLGGKQLNDINFGTFLGEMMEEAHNTVSCLAQDKQQALARFEQVFACFLDNYSQPDGKLDSALESWANDMKGIPLSASPEDTPKVLIFGGLNLLFVHYPVTEYFLSQDILPKVIESSEGACFLESEGAIRYGFEAGYVDPRDQLSLRPDPGHPLALMARKSKISISMIDSMIRKFRSIMEATGLMFDRHIPFTDIVYSGHEHYSYNSFTETTLTTGRFVKTVEEGYYDGLVNMGSFNCQPAMNSQAVIRPLANRTGIAYAAIDCEGPWISANQERLLETVAVRAKKRKQEQLGQKADEQT